MKYFCNFLKKMNLICFLIFFCLSQISHAEEPYVYCSNKNKEWHWLKDDLGDYATVKGRWYYYLGNSFIFDYFLPEGTEFIYLYEKYEKQHGKSFQNSQPANKHTNGWHPFAITHYLFMNGIIQCNVTRKSNTLSDYFVKYREIKFLNNKYPYNDPKHIFLTEKNILDESVFKNFIFCYHEFHLRLT